ncbi:MAG: hypothetical protein EBZ59_00570 [Planctomycetia bacterium]|nr:hypothetical protein [Planctomycetia bacterium]
MRIKRTKRSKVAGLLPAVLACCCLAGCSSSGYDADLAARVDAFRTASDFSRLLPQPTTLAGGRVRLRVPRVFDRQLDGKENPQRATPPFLREYPGFDRAVEKLGDVAGGRRMAAVLTLGAIASAEKKREDIEAMVLKQVQAEAAFAKAVWRKDRELSGQDGERRRWDVLELKGLQPFDRIAGDNSAESTPSAGHCQVWVSADPKQEHCVVLTWRVPDEMAAAVPVEELAPLVARSLEHAAAEAAPSGASAVAAPAAVTATSAAPARRPGERAEEAEPRHRSRG